MHMVMNYQTDKSARTVTKLEPPSNAAYGMYGNDG
jgi:hypothetical protein